MRNYQAPRVIELGTVGDLTRGTGSERAFDSEYAADYGRLAGFVGFLDGSGGALSGSNG